MARLRGAPVNYTSGSVEDFLLVIMAVCICKVIGADEDDHCLGHMDGRELPSIHDPPLQVGRLVACRPHTLLAPSLLSLES